MTENTENNQPENQPPKTAVIGIIAPLLKNQRIIDALWVFETLFENHLDFRAYIVGDGSERDELLRCRDDWALREHVYFLGKQPDTDSLLKQFDVLLHLGGCNADNLSVREAVRLNIPVIATDFPQTRAVIDNESKGILIPDCGEDFRLRRRLFAKKTLRFFRPVTTTLK